MINRQHAVIACDACGRLSESDSNEWAKVWLQAQRAGWRTRKVGKNWGQFCGEVCASKLVDYRIRYRH
jgi:hypothetical protein